VGEGCSALFLVGLLAAALLASPAHAAEKPKTPSARPKPAAETVLTCASLANLRMLARDTKGDAAAVAALFADPKSDHLGCANTPRDRVEAVADRVTVGGTAYECLKVRDSAVCRWTETK
jgi:hypothetical protein